MLLFKRKKGQVEVSAVDPAASMQAVESANLAKQIRNKLQKSNTLPCF
jgi:stage V sporulation protein SpoVS